MQVLTFRPDWKRGVLFIFIAFNWRKWPRAINGTCLFSWWPIWQLIHFVYNQNLVTTAGWCYNKIKAEYIQGGYEFWFVIEMTLSPCQKSLAPSRWQLNDRFDINDAKRMTLARAHAAGGTVKTYHNFLHHLAPGWDNREWYCRRPVAYRCTFDCRETRVQGILFGKG